MYSVQSVVVHRLIHPNPDGGRGVKRRGWERGRLKPLTHPAELAPRQLGTDRTGYVREGGIQRGGLQCRDRACRIAQLEPPVVVERELRPGRGSRRGQRKNEQRYRESMFHSLKL